MKPLLCALRLPCRPEGLQLVNIALESLVEIAGEDVTVVQHYWANGMMFLDWHILAAAEASKAAHKYPNLLMK